MATEVIELATVFNGIVEHRRFEADHASITATGDTLRIRLRAGSDEHGPVTSAIFTPNAVMIRRPVVEDGDR